MDPWMYLPNLKFVALAVRVGSIATGSGRVSGEFFWPGSSSGSRSRLTLWLLVERCGRWLLLLLLLLWSASQGHETLVVSSQKSQSRKMKLSGWGLYIRHRQTDTDRQTDEPWDWLKTNCVVFSSSTEPSPTHAHTDHFTYSHHVTCDVINLQPQPVSENTYFTFFSYFHYRGVARNLFFFWGGGINFE